eukprot:Opistho-2@54366
MRTHTCERKAFTEDDKPSSIESSHAASWRNLDTACNESRLHRVDGDDNVGPSRCGCTHAHVANAKVLIFDERVQATRDDSASRTDFGQEIGGCNALGEADGRHGIGADRVGYGKHLESHCCKRTADGRAGLPVRLESGVNAIRKHFLEGNLQPAHKVHGRRGKVRRLAALVRLHDRHPVLPVAVIIPDGVRPRPVHFQCPLRRDEDRKARGNTERLLRGSENDIDTPLVHAKLLGTRRTDTINNNEGVRAHTLDGRGDRLDVSEHARRCIHVSDCDDAELAGGKRTFNLTDRRRISENAATDISGLYAVLVERLSKVFSEITPMYSALI